MSSFLLDPLRGNGLWRLLVLDRDPADPKWLLATVNRPEEVQPAVLDVAGRYTNEQDIIAVACQALGLPEVSLIPIHDALLWRIDRTWHGE